MKGLVLSGGRGTRLYPLTYTSAKQLIPVANKPVLFRVIEALRDVGIAEIGIVVGDTAEEVIRAVGSGTRWGAEITFIHQPQPQGLAHAVLVSQDFLGDSPFVMFLGDNVIQGGIYPLVDNFESVGSNCQVVLTEVDNPQQLGVAEFEDGRLVRLVEKPQVPPSNLGLVGIYFFDAAIHQAVRSIQPSARGELEITDAIQWLLDQGYQVNHWIHKGWWIDTGKMDDILEANRLLLEEMTPQVQGYADSASKLSGRVTLESGAEVIDSVIRGPAIIGEHTRVVNSYIGPFTAVYHHCLIKRSEVEHSVILEYAVIIDVPRVESSLIGRYAQVRRANTRPNVFGLTLGDHSEVVIPL